MKLSYKPLILALALAASFSTAQAQLITKTFDVTGVSNAVVARFTLWINLNDNTLVVNIDNAVATNWNGKVGTITGIGFNTPFPIASQAGDNPYGTVRFRAKWTTGSAPGLAQNNWSSDDYWSEQTPYQQNPDFNQDYGVTAPNPNYGIEYGEKATFYFKFLNQDITEANVAGFFDNNSSTTNKFDFSVRWQEVDTKWNYQNNCFDGPGSDKGGIDLGFTSDGDLPATPEPSTYGLMGAAALLGLAAHRRRKAAKAAKAA
jgi:hypothetical protein